METGAQVTLSEMLDARERRAALQRGLLAQGKTLLCLTMNVPGPIKRSRLIDDAFFEGMRQIEALPLRARKMKIVREKTGCEAYYLTDADAVFAKRAARKIEDTPPIGRIFDIDVLLPSGEKLSAEALGFPPRSCLLCEKNAFVCARSRAHSVEDMFAEILRRIRSFEAAEARRIGETAVRALCAEAETTPKPGLVDRRNNGSHRDMDLALLKKSAVALEPYFVRCAEAGMAAEDDASVFPTIRDAGIEAERRMLEATHGVNTHKGAIFSLGLLCAAAGRLRFREAMTAENICHTAGTLASASVRAHFSALNAENAVSFGEKSYLETGVRGIRGEAADGFPALTDIALPKLKACLDAGMDRNDAGVRTLLALLARIDDTTLIRRGGAEGAAWARASAARLSDAAGIEASHTAEVFNAAVEALDDAFIRRNFTCGGCADLLACTYFLLDAETRRELS